MTMSKKNTLYPGIIISFVLFYIANVILICNLLYTLNLADYVQIGNAFLNGSVITILPLTYFSCLLFSIQAFFVRNKTDLVRNIILHIPPIFVLIYFYGENWLYNLALFILTYYILISIYEMFSFKESFIFTRKKSFAIGIIFIMVAILSIIFYPFLFNLPIKVIVDEYNSDNSFFSIDGGSKLKDGFSFFKKYYKNYSIVLTNFDVINPKYSLVLESPNASDLSYIQLITLERKDIISWKVKDVKAVTLKKDYETSIAMASRYDLSTNNPDPENITIFSNR